MECALLFTNIPSVNHGKVPNQGKKKKERRKKKKEKEKEKENNQVQILSVISAVLLIHKR